MSWWLPCSVSWKAMNSGSIRGSGTGTSWSGEVERLISSPRRIPILLRIGIWAAERMTGRQMLPARVLAWYPKAAIGSGVLEALVAHREPDERLLKIVRNTCYSWLSARGAREDEEFDEQVHVVPEATPESLAIAGAERERLARCRQADLDRLTHS